MLKLQSIKCIGFKRLKIPENLEFPNGRLLIQGRNESGKSTILEAIHYALYGMGLFPNRNASNEDLINYNLPEALVELKFTIDDRDYTATRNLKKDETNYHQLKIEKPDGSTETIIGARDVNHAIIEELHGIDSDALLNSCLVEQKQLGKLEDSQKSERIRCMTSLLNLETFVDASDEVKKARRDLERQNESTKNQLEKAEKAKELYEEAETKLTRAQQRLEKIKREIEKTSKRIDKIDGQIEIIEEVKKINNTIQTREAQLKGLQGEINQIKRNLNEAIKAEERIKEIKKRIPKAREELKKAESKVEALESLIELESNIKNTKGEYQRTKERIEEASERLKEAKQAKERVLEIRELIKKYKPVEEAKNLLPELEQLVSNLEDAREKLQSLEEKKEDFKKRINSLANAENKIEELEHKEEGLKTQKKAASRNRSIGIGTLFIGILSSFGYLYNNFLIYLGIPLILIGIAITVKSSPESFNKELEELRSRQEKLLGEKSRLEEYKQSLKKAETMLKDKVNLRDVVKDKLRRKISELPDKPRNYSAIINIKDSVRKSFNELRETVNKDQLELTGYITENRQKEPIASELGKWQKNLNDEIQKEKTLQEKISKLEHKAETIEKEHGISSDQAKKIRNNRDDKQRELQELENNLKHSREIAEKKQKYETDLEDKRHKVESISNKITELNATKEKKLKENNLELSQEEELKNELDNLRQNQGELINEQEERQEDVKESKQVMKENKKLKKEYPKLAKQAKEEQFDLKAMRYAIKLLEVTRDGIIGGVKGRVETNMIRFLPELTNNRYSMVRIDENDYRIEVYDKQARRWRSKGIFSGATQDQFSLSLRLAFALSTIPTSRGARPGFIFLDEPLSGFDIERRQGFLDLLKGELAKHFEQIIVISHLEELREEFPNYIKLEEGKIILNT